VVRRSSNTKALHLAKQRGALQAESGGCSSRTTELPIGALTSNEDRFTHLIFKRRIRNPWLQQLELPPVQSAQCRCEADGEG
jgi:hypothetical protein